MDAIDEMQDLTKMKVPELKKLLKAKGLSVTGNKSELLERLQLDMGKEGTELGEDEVIQDEEDVNDDSMLDEEDELELDGDKDASGVTEEKENTGKITAATASGDGSQAEESTEKSSIFKAKPITSGNTADTDKLKSRAERFGVQSEDAKKKNRMERFGVVTAEAAKDKRAERFGLVNADSKTKAKSSGPIAVVSPLDAEKLKKRAERFGATVSSQMSEIKDTDALKKRADRFGQITSEKLTKIETVEKAEKRKARFGTPITFDSSDSEQNKKKSRADRFAIK